MILLSKRIFSVNKFFFFYFRTAQSPLFIYISSLCKRGKLAERVGFEPTFAKRRKRFSRPPHSTTLAPLLLQPVNPPAGGQKWRRSRDLNPGSRLLETHDFQSCSLSHSDTSPPQKIYLHYCVFLFSLKNSVKSSPHSSASTPPCTSGL